MKISEKLKEIIQALEKCEDDALKSETGNASAGRRLRKASMLAIKDLKELRVEILEKIKKVA
tara:strand:+ start:1735 stop:1920 length:186 start_codon:yes stop_codon:yes gene_type:complete